MLIKQLWYNYSHIGISKNADASDRRNIILGNQVVLFISLALVGFGTVSAMAGIYRVPMLVGGMLTVFIALTALIYNGYFFLGRLIGVSAQNFCIFLCAVFLGDETRIIDFLIISSLLPLVLFNLKERNAIAFCIGQNFLLYVLFHLFQQRFTVFALPHTQQMLIYNFTMPLKFLIILMVVYIIIKKREDEQKRHNEIVNELEHANEGLKQFAYITSHDLKTPIRNISTYLQLIKRRQSTDPQSSALLDEAVKSVMHLNQLIHDIFLYTTTNYKNSTVEKTSLNDLIHIIAEELQEVITQRQAVIDIMPGLPPVKMQKNHAHHLFGNLIANAITYNQSATPQVVISCTVANGYNHYRIADNGIGIDAKYKYQVFQVFKRLHTQDEYEGTGIGLAICKKIAESYGGYIELESNAGQGSVFTVSLPAGHN